MAKFQLNLTSAGSALLGQVMTSRVLTFTQMALGDGEHSGGAWNVTALISEQKRVDITSAVASAGSSEVLLRSTLTYADLPDTFYWREFGIYAKDPAGGPDILYAYANAGDDYDTIGGSGALKEIILRARVAISDAADLTIMIQSGSTVYVSPEEMAEAIADLKLEVNASIQNIQNIIQQVTGVDPSDPEAEPPNGSMVVTLTHQKSGTVHAFTGLGERIGLVPCQFKAADGYTAGDTATIDGEAYTIQLTGADAPETDLFVSGKSILVDVDTEGKTIRRAGASPRRSWPSPPRLKQPYSMERPFTPGIQRSCGPGRPFPRRSTLRRTTSPRASLPTTRRGSGLPATGPGCSSTRAGAAF